MSVETRTRITQVGTVGVPISDQDRARLHITQPEDWPAPATLQIALTESGSGKTALHAQLEKLPDADAREAMRRRWREALERIAPAAV